MLGRLKKSKGSVAVIGGGASGMLAAYYLDLYGFDVTLIEKTERLGGMISTTESEFGIVESAANSLVASPELYEFAENLGVVLDDLSPDATDKYILYKGRMVKNPLSPVDMMKAAYGVFLKRAPETTHTMRALAESQFGRKVADYIVDPMVAGIYGADSREIAVEAAFPNFFTPKGSTFYRAVKSNRAQKPLAHRSPKKRHVVAPRGGMGALFGRLGDYLQQRLGDRLRLSESISVLPDVDNIVICTPAGSAATLLRPEAAHLADLLEQVQYTPMVSAGVFIENTAFARVPRGLGVLIPPAEQRRLLGVLFSSASFPNRVFHRDLSLLTVMMGEISQLGLLAFSDDELRAIITEELTEIFGLKNRPIEVLIQRWPQGIPLYSAKLLEVWQTARDTWCREDGHILFGNYSGEVSLRGMLEKASQLPKSLAI